MEISKTEMANAANVAAAAASSSPAELRGGEILVKALQAENVKYIWGYPGGAVLHDVQRRLLVAHVVQRAFEGALLRVFEEI